MSTVKGTGKPTRKTAGGVGDTYIDITNGDRYKCTNAYGVHGEYDYQWKLIRTFGKTTEPVTEVEKPIQQEASKPAVTEVKEEPAKVVEEPKAEPVKTEKKQKSQKKTEKPVEKPAESAVEASAKRTNYAAAYKSKSEE